MIQLIITAETKRAEYKRLQISMRLVDWLRKMNPGDCYYNKITDMSKWRKLATKEYLVRKGWFGTNGSPQRSPTLNICKRLGFIECVQPHVEHVDAIWTRITIQ